MVGQYHVIGKCCAEGQVTKCLHYGANVILVQVRNVEFSITQAVEMVTARTKLNWVQAAR